MVFGARCDPPTLFAQSSFPDVCVYRALVFERERARVRNHLAQPLHGEALPLAACANRKIGSRANKQTLLRHQCDAADAALAAFA